MHAGATCSTPCSPVATAGARASLAYSLAYAPPEVIEELENRTTTVVVSMAVDIWALGVIAFELLTGLPPFAAGLPRAAVKDQIAGREKLRWERVGAPECDDALARLRGLRRSVLRCLHRNPAQRPTCEALLASWNHMFDKMTSTVTALPTVLSVSSSELSASAAPAAPPPQAESDGDADVALGDSEDLDASTDALPAKTAPLTPKRGRASTGDSSSSADPPQASAALHAATADGAGSNLGSVLSTGDAPQRCLTGVPCPAASLLWGTVAAPYQARCLRSRALL
jgi:serine/threonine protein kinase